jgi:hypothetical protein
MLEKLLRKPLTMILMTMTWTKNCDITTDLEVLYLFRGGKRGKGSMITLSVIHRVSESMLNIR